MEAAQIYNDIPAPKYRIGQTVFYGTTYSATGQHPCPDCLGTGKWKVTTPAGSEMTTGCLRCGSYSSSDIPSLKYQTWKGSVQELTIGSVQIDTAAGGDHWHKEPIRYMCRETGIGSGSVYDESKLFATAEEAQAVADAQAAAAALKEAGTPKRLEMERVSHLRIEDANTDAFKNGLWQSWYRYRDLREKLESWKEDENAKVDDIRWDLDWELGYDKRHVESRQIFERIIAAAVKSNDPDLKALVADLPFKPIEEPQPEEVL